MERTRRFAIGRISPQTSARISNAGLIAAFLVVFIHIDIQPDCPSYVSWTVDVVEAVLCGVAVPTFFVIAGYLLAGRVGESGWWARAIRKRAVTLGVLYLLWGTLFFFFDYFRSHDASLLGLIRSLGFTSCEMPGLYPLWFVRSLFALVLASPVLTWLLSRFGKALLVGLFALALVGPVVRDSTFPVVRIAGNVFVVFGGMFYFAVGLFLRSKGTSIAPSTRRGVSVGIVGLLLTVTGAMGKITGYSLVSSYCSTVGVPLLMTGLWRVVPSARWPEWLTGCAFPIFLLHVFAIGVCNNFLFREVNGFFSLLGKYVFAVALPIVAVLAAKRVVPRLTAFAFGGRC